MTPREALLAIREVLLLDSGRDSDIELTVKIDSLIQEGLAHPLRNCEVGTAEEKKRRFVHFCRCDCDVCPISKTDKSCLEEWEQMPYEEGEK